MSEQPERQVAQKIFLSKQELFEAYPSSLVEEFIDDPNKTDLTLMDDKKLMTAEERIDSLGKDLLSQNVKALKGQDRTAYLILQACRKDPIVSYEIERFAEMLGCRIGIVDLQLSTKELMNGVPENLERISGLVYITREEYSRGTFGLEYPVTGYLTTIDGVRQAAQLLARMPAQEGRKAIWVPNPQSV